MNQKQFYWPAQIIGWTVYSLSQLIGYSAIFSFDFDEINSLIGNGIVNIAAGIALTHLFRIIFNFYNWIKLPVSQLILRCIGVIIIITLVLAAINIPMDSEIIHIEKMNWALRDITYLINLSKPVLIWVLIYVFYSYTNVRKDDAIERLKLESSIKETEAKVLRAQMNPHFMFNALNSIRALVTEDPQKSITAITQLSNLLRSSLVADRRATVSLNEEIKTVENYLSLEKIRYEERLQSKWQIDPATLNLQVPPMILQTLVENAIKHGVQKAQRWGFVEITTYTEENKLLIKIRNTGKLKSTEQKSENSGFGIQNTRLRLNLLYGPAASLKIFQENHLTVCAEIRIPIEHFNLHQI